MSLISPQALECCLGPELKVLWWVLNTYNVSLTCLLGSEHKVLWWVLNSYTALKSAHLELNFPIESHLVVGNKWFLTFIFWKARKVNSGCEY